MLGLALRATQESALDNGTPMGRTERRLLHNDPIERTLNQDRCPKSNTSGKRAKAARVANVARTRRLSMRPTSSTSTILRHDGTRAVADSDVLALERAQSIDLLVAPLLLKFLATLPVNPMTNNATP